MKPIEAAEATPKAAAPPPKSRAAAGSFAKHLAHATASDASVAPATPPAATTTTTTTTTTAAANAASSAIGKITTVPRGLVATASRAKGGKSLAPSSQTAQAAAATPITAALAALPKPLALVLPMASLAGKPMITPMAAATTSTAHAAKPAPAATNDSNDDDDSNDDVAPPAAAPVDAASDTDAAPRTPLEQAVHDLLSDLGTSSKHDDDDPASDELAQAAAQMKPATTEPVVAPHATAPVMQAAPVAPPDAQQMQSAHHAHIVVGDGADRVVLTVAVRGSAVNVTLKTSDDHTAAALARNAGVLDQAMRHRGLDLEQMQTEHEAPRERPQDDQPRAPKRNARPDSNEQFELEEQV